MAASYLGLLGQGRLPRGGTAKAVVVRNGPSRVLLWSSVGYERLRLLVSRSGAPTCVVPSLRSAVLVAGLRLTCHL